MYWDKLSVLDSTAGDGVQTRSELEGIISNSVRDDPMVPHFQAIVLSRWCAPYK